MANYARVTWTELEIPVAATAVAGDLAVTLPALTLSASGAVAGSGVIPVALPAPVILVAGGVAVQGALSVTVPAPRIGGAGAVPGNGALAAALPAISALITATPVRKALVTWAELEIPVGLGQAAGDEAVTLPAIGVVLAGSPNANGALSVTLPAPTLSSQGGPLASGRLARVTWAELQVPSGIAAVAGDLAVALPAPAVSLSGAGRGRRAVFTWVEFQVPDVSGIAGVTLPGLTFSGAGSGTISGAAGGTLPPLICSATGAVSVTGSLTFTIPSLTGGLGEGRRAFGLLGVTLPPPDFSAAATVSVTAASAITLPTLSFSASAVANTRGVLDGTLPSPTFTSDGVGESGVSLSALLPPFFVEMAGTIPIVGFIDVGLPGLRLSRGTGFILREIAVSLYVGLAEVAVTIVSPEVDVKDPTIILFPGNTQPWTVHLASASTSDPLLGAALHVELLTSKGDPLITQADFTVVDEADGDYVASISDAELVALVLPGHFYQLHVWGTASGLSFSTVNWVRGSLLPATTS